MHRRYHHLVLDYVVLFLLLLVCFVSFLKISGSTAKQLQVGFMTSASYALWGIFHHVHEGDLHWKVVVEYSAFALLGFIVIVFLLLAF